MLRPKRLIECSLLIVVLFRVRVLFVSCVNFVDEKME